MFLLEKPGDCGKRERGNRVSPVTSGGQDSWSVKIVCYGRNTILCTTYIPINANTEGILCIRLWQHRSSYGYHWILNDEYFSYHVCTNPIILTRLQTTLIFSLIMLPISDVAFLLLYRHIIPTMDYYLGIDHFEKGQFHAFFSDAFLNKLNLNAEWKTLLSIILSAC